MPEGPEVKIKMNLLCAILKGTTLMNMDVCKESFHKKTHDFERLTKILPATVINSESKGKFGYITLDNGYSVGISFGMTGDILEEIPKPTDKRYKHLAVKFTYANYKSELKSIYYTSIRNFGHIWIYDTPELNIKLNTLGFCILNDNIYTKEEIVSRLRKRNNRSICECLMNQVLWAGIGNYIKSEILYTVKLNPISLVKDINDKQLYELYLAARDLAYRSYLDGGSGQYNSIFELNVYNKSICPRGFEVKRIKTPDKRTTHWVPEVQEC
uniref:Formamidopyrimidine-DNA glycosylase catalytic domain-containing protein n=1 Tax=viral metagenome TaxID=1070528 RepID=A0A6C0J7C2_9ZZZZ